MIVNQLIVTSVIRAKRLEQAGDDQRGTAGWTKSVERTKREGSAERQ